MVICPLNHCHLRCTFNRLTFYSGLAPRSLLQFLFYVQNEYHKATTRSLSCKYVMLAVQHY